MRFLPLAIILLAFCHTKVAMGTEAPSINSGTQPCPQLEVIRLLREGVQEGSLRVVFQERVAGGLVVVFHSDEKLIQYGLYSFLAKDTNPKTIDSLSAANKAKGISSLKYIGRCQGKGGTLVNIFTAKRVLAR